MTTSQALVGRTPETELRSRLLTVLTAIFVTCLLVADITGSKFFKVSLISLGSYTFVTHSVGMLSFPVTFLLTDLINEYFGAKAARRTTYIGLGCAFLAFVLIWIGRLMPIAPESPLPQAAFEQVFAMSNRLYVASLTAYLVGQLCDIAVFGAIKRWTGDRLVWLRATGSTVVSQALDSFLVTFILFQGSPGPDGQVPTLDTILGIAVTGYVLKFVLALGLTPVVYLGRFVIRRKWGLEPAPADG